MLGVRRHDSITHRPDAWGPSSSHTDLMHGVGQIKDGSIPKRRRYGGGSGGGVEEGEEAVATAVVS